MYYNHPDYKIVGMKEGLSIIMDEVREFLQAPSKDEMSDIIYGINRLIGGLFGKKYLKLLPFDGIHIAKCNRRYLEYGHFRSKRHIN